MQEKGLATATYSYPDKYLLSSEQFTNNVHTKVRQHTTSTQRVRFYHYTNKIGYLIKRFPLNTFIIAGNHIFIVYWSVICSLDIYCSLVFIIPALVVAGLG